MEPKHLVLVSDRGPVRFEDRMGELVPTRRNSSVTGLLDGIARSTHAEVTWLAPSTADADRRASRTGLMRDLSDTLGYRYDAVPVSERDYQRYYDDTGVSLIWTAWHGIEDEVPVRRHPLDGYRAVNRALADRVIETASAEATVAIQDYQFLLAPAMIRRHRDDLRIIHFTHTPFPDAKSLDALPQNVVRELVEGMLGADLLGFQRPLWATRFLDCCARLRLPVDRRRVRCYPVTVDHAALGARARAPRVLRWAGRTRTEDRRRVLARVDRLDPAKNALRGFQAYALMLRRRPELAREVRFVACLIPSRERLPDYHRYAHRTRQLIDEINAAHPGAVTVHHGDDQDRAFGVLTVQDVLLVNALADGMNLVAQEGALLGEGAVVLSSGTGAADLLPGAVPLGDPRSVEATADALTQALALPEDVRRERVYRMRAALRARPGWFASQWEDLCAIQ